ncbi:4-hydroxy-tetrahydrodipicolinate reductase [bacterium]|nr:4-hydroxy-tetrahydrodipicolinate reductase [bacterium]
MHKIAIIGSEGRMGTALRNYIKGTDDIECVAEIGSAGRLEQVLDSGADCVVDLSTGEAVDANGASVVNAALPYVIGATGYSQDTVERMASISAERGSPVLIVPNFSIGANLMILFARQAARYMQAPVVTERHHDRKADAPSGTARYTAAGIAEVLSGLPGSDKSSTSDDYSEQLQGVLGGNQDMVAIHSVRGAGYLAEQQVLFSLQGESLSIEHRSIDRNCFMPGIAYCVRNINRVDGLVVGMDRIMEL